MGECGADRAILCAVVTTSLKNLVNAPSRSRQAVSRYCAFGASDAGMGAAAPFAAFFFFFFFFGGSLAACCASGCWASTVDAATRAAGTAKLAAPKIRNSFRREIASISG
jgi:hypothetical protein